MADEPGDDVFALFGDRALGRVWVPDIMLQAGENLRSVLEGKEEQENLAHLHKKYPGVALKITGDISTTILPDKRLHISILCRDRDVLDKVTADVKDLIESVCEHVADTIGIDADELEQAFAGMRMKKYVFSVEREEDDEESEEEDDACANAMPEKTETTTPSTAAQASPKTRPAEGASPQQQKASAGDDKGHAVADPIVIPDAGSDDESGGASTGGSDEDEEEEEEEEDAINESGSEMPHNDSASEMPLETRYDNDSASEMPLRREALEYTDTDADMMNSTDAEDVSRNHASFNERSRVLSPTELAKVKSQQRNEIRTAAVANLSPSNGKASDGLAPSGLQAAVSDMLARKCSPNWIVGSLKAKGYSLEQALSALKAIAVAKLQKPSVVACNLDSDSDEEEAPATLSAGGYDQLPEFLKARLPDWLRGGGQPPAKLEVQKPAMPLKPKATSPPLEPPKTPQPSRPRMSSQQLIAATALLGPGFEEATPEQLVAEFKKRGFTPADVVAKLKELQEAPVAKKLPLEATQGHHGTVQQQQPPNKEDERFEQQEKATVEAPPWDSWEAVDSSQWDWPEQQQTSEAWNGGWEQARNDNGGYQEAQHNQAWESNAQWASAQGADNTEVYPVAPPGLVNQSGAADAQQQSAWSDPNGTWPQGQQWPTSSRHPLAVKKEQEEGQWQTSPQAPPGSNAHPLANTAGWSKLQTLIWMQQQRQQQAMAMQFQQQQIKQTMVVQQQHAMAMHQQLQQQALLMHQQRQQQALAMQMQQQASAASTSTIQGNTHNAICGERMPSPIGPSLVEVKTESSPELHSIAANVSSGVRVKAEDSRMEPAVAPSAPLQNFNLAVTQVKQETLEVASVQPSRPEFSDAKSKADSGLANATLQSFSAALTQVKQEIQEAAARKPTPEESPQKKKEAKEKVIAREKEADEKLKAMHEAVTDKREQAETKSTSATDVTSLVAVRTEAKWSDFKSKWSMPSAPKNWTSMFTAGSNGKPRNLRIFKGSVELRSLTLVHPCVIFGSSLQTAHIADTSHESVQPQHVALLWGASGHFLIDPFGGKVRVSSVQSHPDIAHAMTREARSMPNEEKAIELPIGSGKQLLFPTRCCFQLASSEIVFMVDLLPLPINLDRSDERRRPSVSRSPSDTRKTTRKKRQPPDKKHSPSRKQSRSLSLTRSLQNGERSKERRTPKAAKEARPQSRSQKRSLKDRSGARSPRPLVDKKERKDEQLGEKKKRKLNIRKKEGENRSSSRRKDRRREETKDAAKSSKLMTLMTEVKSEEESEAEDEDVFAAQEQEWRTDKSKDEKASDSKAKAIEKRVASKTEKTSTLEARAEDDRDTKRRIRDDSTKAKRKREDERRSPRRKEQTPAKETGNLRKQDEKARGKQKDSKEPKGKGTEYACQSSKRDERDSRKRKSAKEATLEDEVKSEEESGTGDRNNRSKGSSTKARNALFAEKKDKGNGDKNSTKTKSAKEVGRRSASKAKKEQRRDSNRERCSRTPPRKATHLDRRGTCGNSSSASNRNKLRSRGSCETRRGRKRSPST